jgi:hypothetical protein
MFGYTMKTKYMNLTILPSFFLGSLLMTENLQNHFFFKFLIFDFSFWRNFAIKKNIDFQVMAQKGGSRGRDLHWGHYPT